ncbi:outer membrane transport energization protein ExbB [Epibacterium ulvae]|uniref:Outer membrane transport energization protein ExbB n=1 Tax=Epibacterium ulvae TaxID=1156985 RepID=A0A1G5QS84_9RHOB|nr:MotA/TolQ/ExbB proton channel family protein [Epibacterium ulvae]SCZ64713.1 outer membrane transport energization protein ExbB [Epibacterium ulvae]
MDLFFLSSAQKPNLTKRLLAHAPNSIKRILSAVGVLTLSLFAASAQEASVPPTAPIVDLQTAAPTGQFLPNEADAFSEVLPAQVSLNPALDLRGIIETSYQTALDFLQNGGPSIWAIGALSVITLTLILWKIWRLALIGAWAGGAVGKAVYAFETGDIAAALAGVQGRKSVRSKVVVTAITAITSLPEEHAREETARVAKRHLSSAGIGLGALELIATIAPLLGLLGTVLGMIAAFQALQTAGSRADPALLAGGIWEALLTTAAGMAVAIPASAALTWFESIIARLQRDLEDSISRLFVAQPPGSSAKQMAAE